MTKRFFEKKTVKCIGDGGEIIELAVLVGKDEGTQKFIIRRKDGQVLDADIKQTRNYLNHKRFFDFLNTTFAMQEFYSELEAYRRWITVAAGWFDIMVFPDGATQLNPKSIAFENMDEDEFNKLFSSAINAFLEEFGQGQTEADIMRAISYG